MDNNSDNNNSNNNNIAQSIKDTLKYGLNTGDLGGLQSLIINSAQEAIEEAGQSVAASMESAFREAGATINGRRPYTNRQETQAYAEMLQNKHKADVERQEAQRRMREELKRQRKMSRQSGSSANKNEMSATNSKQLPANFVPVGNKEATTCIIAGATGLVVSGYSFINSGLVYLLSSGSLTKVIFSAICAVGFGIMINVGINKKNTFERAKRYAQLAGNNMYAQLSVLSAKMGITTKKLRKDIKKMLRMGYFPQGYLDDEETTLMLSDNVYKQYKATKEYSLQAQAKAEEDELAMENLLTEASAKLSPEQVNEFKEMMKSGYEYIDRLHELNMQIPGEQITIKLSALEGILKEIFARVKEHPEQMSRMHKLMDYYLPTMIKLVEAYAEYDKVSNPGKDIIDAKFEIEQTLDTINEAFVQLLNNLFQDSVWDVTSDAQVLKTMLKQEGLSKDMSEQKGTRVE